MALVILLRFTIFYLNILLESLRSGLINVEWLKETCHNKRFGQGISALKSSEYGYYKPLKLDMMILPYSIIFSKTSLVNPLL